MDQLSEKLAGYFELSAAEQQSILKEYPTHPEVLKIKKLDALFHSLAVKDEQIEEALSGKSDNERLNQRLQNIHAANTDMVAHFEKTTGQRLSAGMQLHKPKPNVFRYAMAACFSFLALSAVFYFGNQKPAQYALADVRIYADELERPVLRGGISEDALEDLYYRAAADLQAAHVSYLGLFPHYNATKLASAIQQFDEVTKKAQGGSVFQTEAYFFLGKAYLAQGNQQKAKEAFKWVVALNGAKRKEAQKLLKSI